jgi:hypothetical protein
VDQGEGKQKYKVQDGRPEVCHLFLLISGHYDCGVRFALNKKFLANVFNARSTIQFKERDSFASLAMTLRDRIWVQTWS